MVRTKRGDLVNTKKKDPSELRNESIQASVTKREKELFSALAEERHLTDSTFARVIILDFINREGK